MRPVCGDKCFTRPSIHVCCKKFTRGRERVAEEERPGCSQRRFLNQEFKNLLIDEENVETNLDDMLKNKTKFDV